MLNCSHFRWGLETVCRHFLASVSVLKPTKAHKQRNRERGLCVDKSQLKPLLLWVFTYSSYFAVHWPQLPGLQFNSWLVWFIACLQCSKVQRVWWLSWIWLPRWYSVIFSKHGYFFPKEKKQKHVLSFSKRNKNFEIMRWQVYCLICLQNNMGLFHCH